MFRLRHHKAGWVSLVSVVVLAACGARPLVPDRPIPENLAAGSNYRDGFVPGNTGNWLLEQDELGSTAIANEQLVISVTTPNTIQYTTLKDMTFSDFSMEVDVIQRSGPPESSFGTLFRVQDNQEFYRFDITGNGLYVIERHNGDGSWTRLVPDWMPSPALNQGVNVTNRLRVLATGDTLAFYANDVLLTQLTDATLSGGQIGFDAGTFGGGNLQVAFDNLDITIDSQ